LQTPATIITQKCHIRSSHSLAYKKYNTSASSIRTACPQYEIDLLSHMKILYSEMRTIQVKLMSHQLTVQSSYVALTVS